MASLCILSLTSSNSDLSPSRPRQFDGQAATEYKGVESGKALQLLSIYFQLLHPAKFVPNLRACSAHDVEAVASGDKKALLAHMEEKIKVSE